MKEDRRTALLEAAKMIANSPMMEGLMSTRVIVQDRRGQSAVVELDFKSFRRLVELQRGGQGVTPGQLLAEVREEYPDAVRVEFNKSPNEKLTIWPPRPPESVDRFRAVLADVLMPRDADEYAFMLKAIHAEQKKRIATAERQRADAFRALERKQAEFSRDVARLKERHEKEALSQSEANGLLREVVQGYRLPLALLEQAVTGKQESFIHGLDDRDFLIVMAMFARKQKTNRASPSRDTRSVFRRDFHMEKECLPEDLRDYTFAAEMTDEDIAKIVGLSRQTVITRRRTLNSNPAVAAVLKLAAERYGPDSRAFIPKASPPSSDPGIHTKPAAAKDEADRHAIHAATPSDERKFQKAPPPWTLPSNLADFSSDIRRAVAPKKAGGRRS